MRTIVTLSIIRFNDHEAADRANYIISESTTLESLKDALLNKLESVKAEIIAADTMRFADGEVDGFEKYREATHDEVVEAINEAQSIKDFNHFGRFDLDDGMDVDTCSPIISHITIWSDEAVEL